MCLKTVGVTVLYDDKAHAFVGYGWKRMETKNLKRFKKWQQANGDRDYIKRNRKLKDVFECGSDGNRYTPGFHIFLTEKDATDYKPGGVNVVKVKFKGILSYGTQSLDHLNSNAKCVPCVVTEWMKLA